MPLRRRHANRIGLLAAAAIFVVIGVGNRIEAYRLARQRGWL